MNKRKCLVELCVSGKQLRWSKDVFAAKFNASYQVISSADHVEVGAVELFPDVYSGRRWIHWEAAAGRVCLKEIWLDHDLIDHTICLQLGGSHLGSPLSVHFECIPPSSDNQNSVLRACFVTADGCVHNIVLEAIDKDSSFLAGIVDLKEGGLVESIDADCDIVSGNGLVRTHQLSEASLNSQTVSTCSFLSHFAIVFGLSGGDIIYLRMTSGGGSVFVETVMRYAGVVQSLLSGLVGSNSSGVTPKVMVVSGSHLRDSSVAVAYTADGSLSVWDCLSRRCVRRVTVFELLSLAGGSEGGISIEDVKLDTCPIDFGDNYCLGIVLGISTRIGRERRWHIEVFTYLPSNPRTLIKRGKLIPPKFSASLLSTNVSLEQISLTPCGAGSRSGHGDTIASLWRVGSEVLPVAHDLPNGDFSWIPSRNRNDNSAQRGFPAHFVSLGPAERHAQWRLGDQVFDEAVISSFSSGVHDATYSKIFRWNAVGSMVKPPSGSGVNVEIDMHYLRTSFLQRLFSPGRFPYTVIVRAITQDIPYDVQELCAQDGGWDYDGLMETLLAKGMDTYVEEREHNMLGYVTGPLGGSDGNIMGAEHKFSSSIESPLEVLVKAVIAVCGKYEELVLDRLLQQSHQESGFAHLDSHISTKLKRYRSHSPSLSLKAQVEVCQHILQLCEDRLCRLRSGVQSCSLLVHTRGGTSTNLAKPDEVPTPFEFVVVRPTGLGVVVSTSLVVNSEKEYMPDYTGAQDDSNVEISSFMPFSFAKDDLVNKNRLLCPLSEDMTCNARAFALLDTLLLRYVTDVSYFHVKENNWFGGNVGSVDNVDGDMDGESNGTESEDYNLDSMPKGLVATVKYLFEQSSCFNEEGLERLFENFQSLDSIAWNGSDFEVIESVDVLFADLLSMPSLVPDLGADESNCTISHNPMQSTAGAELLLSLCAVTTQSAYVYYQAVACVFLGLLKMCSDSPDPVFGQICTLINDKYIQVALTIVVHYSFIQWTECVHFSSHRQLEKLVDFRDLVYNSSMINMQKKSLQGYDCFSLSQFESDVSSNETSILLSFWQQFSPRLAFEYQRHDFWGTLSQRCLFALRPSTHSDYTSFLVDTGQYSLAVKSSSLAVRNEVQPMDIIDSSIMQYFIDTHDLAIQRITGIQMYLHDITTAARGNVSARHQHSMSDTITLHPSDMEEIKDAVSGLIAMFVRPANISNQFSIHDNVWSCYTESNITYGAGHGVYSLERNLMTVQDIDNCILEWTKQCQEKSLEDDAENACDVLSAYCRQERDEGLLCTSEGLFKLARTPYFRVFFSAVCLMLRESEDQSDATSDMDTIEIILRCYPDILMLLQQTSLAMNFHNLVDRSRALLPLHFGVELALMSGRAAVGILEEVINSFTDMFNAWHIESPSSIEPNAESPCRLTDAAIHSIRKELENVLLSLYANILDISLLSCLLDEGYDAVTKLIILSHQSMARDQFWAKKNALNLIASTVDDEQDKENMEDGGDDRDDEGNMLEMNAMSTQWKSCLRSLVLKACSCGKLQWVCARSDIERLLISYLVHDDNSGNVSQVEEEHIIDMTKEIVKQVEFVCNSSDFTDYFSGGNAIAESDDDSNSLHLLALYDCLSAFLLSKGLRRECARILLQLVLRLDDELIQEAENDDDFDAMRILDPQSRAMATAVSTLYHEDVSISQRYVVLRSASSVRGYQRIQGDNALLHVTLADMEHIYLQVQCKISLVRSASLTGEAKRTLILDDSELVRGLCSQGNFYDAINLAISATNRAASSGGECPEGVSSIGRSHVLEHAISVMASSCLSGRKSGSSMPDIEAIQQFSSALGFNLPSLLEYEDTLSAPKLLSEYLVHCLQCLDGPTGNWSLHTVATDTALRSFSEDFLSSPLVDSYCGFSSAEDCDFVHEPTISGMSGNISAFLLQLLQKGYLIQACDTAAKWLSLLEPNNDMQECVPYSVIDRVMDACSQVFEINVNDSGQLRDHYEALKSSHDNLVGVLEKYFCKLLVVEAGPGINN